MVFQHALLEPDGAAVTVGAALGRGIRSVNGRKPLWIWFYAITTLWALAIVTPVMVLVYSMLGQSAWTERMSANFDLQFLGELTLSKGLAVITPLGAAGAALAVIAAVSHLFLVGGALHLFWSEKPFSNGAFFHGCGRNFWRFVRLALVCACVCVGIAIGNNMLARAGNKIWDESSWQTPLVYWTWFRVATFLLLLGFVNLISDYARVGLVASEKGKAIRAFFGSLRLVLANFGSTAGLYLAVWMILIALLALYRGAEAAIGQSTLGLAIVLLLVRQLMALAKTWTQLLFCASETEMYRALTYVPPPPEPEPPAPSFQIPEPTFEAPRDEDPLSPLPASESATA
jgi:hypothetical protein